MAISIVHDSVPGRLRLKVPKLYRRPAYKRQLERLLGAVPEINSVNANELTAAVLILHAPQIDAAQLLQDIADTLNEALAPRASFESAKPARRQPARVRQADATASSPQPQELWHVLSADAALARLQSTEQGLVAAEIERRLQLYGANLLSKAQQRSALVIFLKQFQSLPVALLGASAVIALVTGGIVDAIAIGAVVMTNATIGYFTEANAEQAIARLDDLGPRRAEVLRDGRVALLPMESVVPGDILLLSPGTQIAADARLLHAERLSMDESALTGESMPASKNAAAVLSRETMLGDRKNMVYMGTLVTGGSGIALVVNTAAATELGRIQSLVETTHAPQTPMEIQLGRLGNQLGILSALVCVGVFGVGILRGQPWLQMLNSAMSLAVAAVPEGLPAVATTTLALGIKEMQQRRVAVRKLEAVESLGSLQVLCLDKTGTLTANHMSVVAMHHDGQDFSVHKNRVLQHDNEISIPDGHGLQRMLEVSSLCSEVEIDAADGSLSGSPTEVALVELAQANRIDVSQLRQQHQRVLLKMRAENRPWMSSHHKAGEDYLINVKGSPVELLQRSDWIMRNNDITSMTEADRDAITAANMKMASNALRVLAVAYRRVQDPRDTATTGLVWLGLVGLQDPLRDGMPELIEQYHRAGIKTVMITGDQSATAYAIARQLKLDGKGSVEILDSSRLDQLGPELLAGLVRKVDVFSRVSPAHKLRIVQAYQQAGKVVAMTGDGINDGPALKAANVGVAMGGSGTDVARSVSDVVIEDDNLHTMAEAVRQGRTIYANIRKSVHYLLSTNFSEIEVMLGGIASGMGQPLNPMQLLWINLATDIFPALALSLEPPDKDVMQLPPRPADEAIITNEKLGRMALESALISASALGAFLIGKSSGGLAKGSTLAFHSLTLAQLIHSTACRSDRYGLFNPASDKPRNHWLDMALGGTLALHLLTMVLPGFRRLLGTTPMGLRDLAVVVTAAVLPLLGNESIKAMRQHNSEPDDNNETGNETGNEAGNKKSSEQESPS
ncbi:MAG: HAD-IC family P-type ATPase [Chromatiales bacterium]